MATVVNARDVQLALTSPRLGLVTMASNIQVDQSNVTGLGLIVAGTKQIWLSSTSQIFQIPKAGSTTPASITVTANVRNLTATPTFTIVSGSGTMSVVPALTAGVFTFTPAQLTSDAVTLRLTLVENSVTYTDDLTVVKVREGIDSISGYLTNESHTLPGDSSGNVTNYGGAGGNFKVFQGTTDVTSVCTFALVAGGNPDSLTYTLTTAGSSAGAFSVTGGYPTAKNVTTLTFRATFGTSTIDKIFTVSKANTGATGAGGSTGAIGPSGARGSQTFYVTLSGGTNTYSDTLATTTATSNGGPVLNDVVVQYNNSVSFSQTKFWNGTAWVIVNAVVDGNLLVSGTVGTAALSANAVTAGKIGANEVTTDKLRVTGKGSALNDDPSFSDPAAWTITTGAVAYKSDSTATGAAGNLYIDSTTLDSRAESRNIQINPARTYRLIANLYSGTGSDRGMFLYIRMFTATGTEITGAGTGWGGLYAGYLFGGVLSPQNRWVECGGQFGSGVAARRIPTNVAYIRIGVWLQYSTTGSNLIQQACQNLRLVEAVDASVVVDGSLTATKIDTRGLSIKDASGNVILAAGSPLSITNLSDQQGFGFSQEGLRKNMVDPSRWAIGVDGWNSYGAVGTQTQLMAVGSDGNQQRVWQVTSTIGQLSWQGGPLTRSVTINPAKTYRYIIPIKRVGANTDAGIIYVGVQQGDSNVCDLNTSTLNTNAYLASVSLGAIVQDRWYVVVGYVYPAGSSGLTNNEAGVYDSTTGVKTVGGTNLCWAASASIFAARQALYSSSAFTSNVTVQFGQPLIQCIDGSEDAVVEFFAPSAFQNSAITIAADGTLSGAGGGKVTPAGLGVRQFQAFSRGNSSTTHPVGVPFGLRDMDAAVQVGTGARSYHLNVLTRDTGASAFDEQYDVYGGATTANIYIANALLWSEDFTNSAWLTNVPAVTKTVTAGVVLEDGSTGSVMKITENAASSIQDLYQTYALTAVGTRNTYFDVKSAERGFVKVTLGSVTNGATAIFGISAGTVSTAAVASGTATTPVATITSLGNGWYRCHVGATFNTVETLYTSVCIRATNSSAGYAGTVGSGIYVRRAQLGFGTALRKYRVSSSAARYLDAAALAEDLNATDASQLVVVTTCDEPKGYRLTGGLDAAVYRCGGSKAIFGSSNFKSRASYVLIGIPGCGEGNGYESYAGDVDNDPNAWSLTSFSLQNGLLNVSGTGSNPRALTDYGYTGDLAATAGVTLVATGAVTVSGSSATKTTGTLLWDAEIYSVERYVGGAYVSFSPAQVNSAFMLGLNTDPTSDVNFASIDYAFYIQNDGKVSAYESGTAVTLGLPTYSVGDVFTLSYDGSNVRYYQNTTLLRTASAAAGLALHLDSSFHGFNATATKIKFGPLSSNNWTSVGGVNKPADNATVGAQLGVNMKDSIGTVLADGAVLNSALDIGGSNLWKNSETASFGSLLSGTAGISLVSMTLPDLSTGNAIQIVATTAVTVRVNNAIRGNDIYAVSVYHKVATGTANSTIDICDVAPATPTLASTTAWKYYRLEGHTVTNYSETFHFIDLNIPAGVTLHIWHPQCEYGNKVTDWKPAVEDVAAGISTAATTANWASVNSRPANIAALNGTEGVTNSSISISATGVLSGAGGGQVTALPTIDLGAVTGVFGARTRNDAPSEYPYGTTKQFKTATNVGLNSSNGTYCTIETIKQSTDLSGGGVYQYGYQGTTTWRRYSANPVGDATTWGAWVQDLDRNAYTGTLDANTTTVDAAGKIQGVASGAGTAVSNDVIAFAGNVCYNADFSHGLQGWTVSNNTFAATYDYVNSSHLAMAGATWTINGGVGEGSTTLHVWQNNATTTGYFEILSDPIPVIIGKRYIVSAYTGAHRASADVFVFAYDSAGAMVGSYGNDQDYNAQAAIGGQFLSGYKRHAQVFIVPAGVGSVRVAIRKIGTVTPNTDSWMFVGRVQLEEVGPAAVTPGPWNPPGFGISSTRQITGTNVSTFIASAAIGDAQIGTLNASKIVAGTITTDKLEVNSVNILARAAASSGFVHNWTAGVNSESKTLAGPSINAVANRKLETTGHISISVEFPAAATTVDYVGVVVDAYFSYTGAPAAPALQTAGPGARQFGMSDIRPLIGFSPPSGVNNVRGAYLTVPFKAYVTPVADVVATPIVRYTLYYLTSTLTPTTTPVFSSSFSNTESYSRAEFSTWVTKV